MVPNKIFKSRRGRPATGRGRQTGLRIPLELDEAIDHWIDEQANPKLTKPEAIRRLLKKALDAEGTVQPDLGSEA
jgi:hypothetical protein